MYRLRRYRYALIIAIATVVGSSASAQSIVQAIPFPNTTYWNQAYDLAGDTTGLYVTSSTSTSSLYNYGFIYKLDLNGNRIDSISTGMGQSQGLTYDGTNFYYVRRYTSTCTVMKLTASGTLVDSLRFTTPTRLIGGAVWADGHLWVSDYTPTPSTGRPAVILKIDWTTKSIVDSIITIGLQPTGVAWDGQYIYYAMDRLGSEPNLNLIYVVNPATGDTIRTIEMPEPPTTDSNPRGLLVSGQSMWLIARPVGGGTGQVLYRYDLSGSGTPDINIIPTLISYGGVRIGQPKESQVTIQNVGTANLTLDSVRVLLSPNVVASISTPVSIPASQSILMPVTFTPVSYGSDTASIRIHSNDPDEGLKILPARGFGIYGSPFLSTASSYGFGTRRVGSTSSWRMTIENRGAEQLSISSMATSIPNFYIDSLSYPLTLDSLASRSFRVWFNPTAAAAYTDTLKITSNASNGAVLNVVLTGTGDATGVPIGIPLWNYTVVNHPISNTFRLVKAVRAMNDINGDGKPEIIISTENYWTMAVNGNASVDNDSLWAFTTYISSSSAGSIGTTGDYSHQKALGIARDLNGDGFNDVVIGTGGGNERVYAINGRNGQMLWSFGTDHPDSFSLGDFTGVDVSTDYNNDNVPDVIAAAAATQSGGLGGRRSVYLFNGSNGQLLWQAPLLGFTHGVTAISDISGDGIPDVIGAVGEAAYRASAYSGVNGALLWDFSVPSSTGGGKEVLILPIPGQTPDLILGAFWGPVYRVDAETGTQVWSYTTGSGVMQLARLRDITGDGIDELLVALLGGGARCLNGATGAVIWSLATGNTMGITSVPDMNQDTFDDAAIAVQSQGVMIVKGQDGQQLALYSTSPNQAREVAAVPDMDGNFSYEIIFGGNVGNVGLISGGVDAGPTSVGGVGGLPKEFSVSQNYPNPFNPSTTVEISMPYQGDVTLTIFDILGRKIRSFAYERLPAGVHRIEWDGQSSAGSFVSSGVYFYQVRSGDFLFTKRMLLLR